MKFFSPDFPAINVLASISSFNISADNGQPT
jgi:hypothetical protein